MKFKSLIFLITLCLSSSSTILADVSVKSIRLQGGFPVFRPFMTDSVNVDSKKSEVSDLLNLHFAPLKGVKESELKSDTAGWFALPVTANVENELYQLTFFIKSDRFTKADLEVKAPGRFQIWVNGKKETDKNSVEDSLNSAKKATVKLSLEPRDYEISIRYLREKEAKCAPNIAVELKSQSKATIETAPQMLQIYTMQRQMEGQNFRSVSLSPNGKYALVRFHETLPGGNISYYSRLYDLKTKQFSGQWNGQMNSLSWMPKSNLLYVTRNTAEGRSLITIDPVTLQERTLRSDIPDGGFSFSRDERFLICFVTDNGPKEGANMRRVIMPDDRIDGWRNRSFLYRFDLQTGVMDRLTFGFRSCWYHDMSSDSQSILFSVSTTDLTQRPFSKNTLLQMDLNTLKTDTVWNSEIGIGDVRFSPDGKTLLVKGSGSSFDGIGRNILPNQKSNEYDGQLFLFDFTSKKVDPITKEFDPAVDGAQWMSDGSIILKAEDKDFVRLFSYHPKTRKFSILATAEEVVQGYDIAKEALVAMFYGQSSMNFKKLYTLDLKKGKSELVLDLHKEERSELAMATCCEWNFVSKDGSNINGRYYLPKEFDPSKKYPMIVYYYGGTSPTSRVVEHPYPSHSFAAQGYIVYVINPSGTTGYGQKFAARHVNAWGKRTAEEIIEGTEKFCTDHSFVDKSKIGCIGASYGGFMTQYLQTRTDLFAAAVSHAGISNIASYWGEGYWGYSYSSVASADSYPWNNPKLYTEQSPLFSADKIKTPLLLLHGMVDTNVPIGESIQMFNALKLLGKEVEFLQFTDENHGIANYKRRIEWHNATLAWFGRWLKDEPEWWFDLFPKRNL